MCFLLLKLGCTLIWHVIIQSLVTLKRVNLTTSGPVINNVAVVYPWVSEQVFVFRMPFLASISCRLGKRSWNLETSSVVEEFLPLYQIVISVFILNYDVIVSWMVYVRWEVRYLVKTKMMGDMSKDMRPEKFLRWNDYCSNIPMDN